jgi:GTP-binding protein SAR1
LLSNPDLSKIPFLVLGNKIDIPRAMSEDELRVALGLHNLTTGKGNVELKDIRPIEVFMCSIVNKQGYGDGKQITKTISNRFSGIRWLSQYL